MSDSRPQLIIETPTGYMLQCRHCQWHEIPKQGKPGASWTFNGDIYCPTFTPSMNEWVNKPDHPSYNPECPSTHCHFIVTAGEINYCGDCNHELAGKSFPLEPWPEDKCKYYAALMAEQTK